MITSNPENRKWLKPFKFFAIFTLLICFLTIQASIVFSSPSAAPEISIGNATITEGNSGITILTFELTRTGSLADLSLPSQVFVSSTGVTATDGVDYQAVVSEAVEFGSTEVSKTLDVVINDDLVVETDEEFILSLTAGLNATIGDGSGTGTIKNNDEANVSLVADAEAFENEGVINFEVEISNPVAADVVVEFSTTDISTVFGDDIKLPTSTVTFPANSTATQTASIIIADEAIVEANETFEVSLVSVSASGLNVGISDATVVGTVKNDDTATVDITHATPVYEGSAVLYTASLSAEVDGGVTIDYQTTSGSAGDSADFVGISGSLVFTGDTTQEITLTVDILDEDRVEDDETFTVDLTFDSASTVAEGSIFPLNPITTTIINTDTTTVDLIGGTIIDEEDSGSTDVSFTLSLANIVKNGFSIPVIVTAGSAISGTDYVHTTEVITFEENDSTESFEIEILGDEIVEGDETFTVTLGEPIGVAVDSDTIIPTGIPQIVTIKNDDIATIQLTASAKKSEGAGSYPFDISVDRAVQDGFSVSYATSDGTATTADGDFNISAGQQDFDGLEDEIETVHIVINDEDIVEADETFAFNLISITDSEGDDITDRFVFATETLTGTIENDDVADISLRFLAPLVLSDGVVKADEGNSGSKTYQALATLDSEVQGGFSIDYSLGGGTATAGTDYESTSGTLSFDGNSAGAEIKSFNIVVYGDQSEEENETFLVSLDGISNTTVSVSDFQIIDSPTTFEITNDDGTIVTVSVDPSEVLENTTAVEFTVELDSPSFETVTVDYEAVEDSALLGSDFVAASGTLTFAPNETVKNVSVSLLNDAVSEGNEILFLQLSNASNATIGAEDKAALTIIDDDGLPSVSLDSDSYQLAEGGSAIPVTVTLSRISSQSVSVLVRASAGTASSPNDFVFADTPVTFAPGVVEKTIMISAKDDSVFERDEEFSIGLGSYINAEAGTITEAVVGITENDLAPIISISDVAVSETNDISTMNFIVSLSEVADVDISVSFETQDGTARVADGDYVASAGRIVIPAGSLSAPIEITVNGDRLGEGNEFFRVILSAPSDDNLDSTTNGTIAVGTLENDDFFQVMLPIVTNGRINAPDLVPVSIDVDGDSVSIKIQNRGPVAVTNSFWVDLFVDPSVLPTKPNHTTQALREVGLIWFISGATLPIDPGETITIKTGDSNFNAEFSDFTGTIPAGTLLVVHVDSADSATNYGAVEETHEQNNGIYNNILNSTTSREVLIR